MPLDPMILGDALASMPPTTDEAEAINGFATAWDDYFQAASVSGAPVSGSTAGAKSALKSALVGFSTAGGPALIQAGIIAYWGAISLAAPGLWLVPPNALSPAVPPTTLSGIAAALQAAFASNTTGRVSLDAAAQNLASVLHANGGLGATITIIPPLPTPPVPLVPIL